MMSNTPERIRAIIVDDEMPARENLRYMLADHCPQIEVVGMADGPDAAETLFSKEKPELIFLDIRMPSGSEGFELIERLQGNLFYVVFVTAFKDHAIQAFEKRALHYILKPIDEGDLLETVARLMVRRNQDAGLPERLQMYRESLKKLEEEVARQARPKRITINHSKGVKIIDPTDISSLEGKGNCALIHFTDGTSYLDTRTLKTYEQLLSNDFFRTHKSHIVNLAEISEILHGDDQSVVLKGGKTIPVSRDRKKALLEAIQKLIW
jgi:two-component system LytT family response regulator